MKIKFMGIEDDKKIMAAVKQNGHVLRYVLNKELFVQIAIKLNIDFEL